MVIKGFKYFIAYKTDYENDDEKVMPLCIMLPKKKISTYRRDFDETKYMSFLIKDNKLLWKYVKVWNKGSKFIKSRFDSESLNNEKYLKSKVTSYEGKINTNFHNNKMFKEGSHCICISVVLIDSVFKMGKYSSVFRRM